MTKIKRMLKHMILQRKAALLLLFAAAFFGGQMTGMVQNRYEISQEDRKIPAAAKVMTAEQTVKYASDGENWGLSFQEEGKPPTANASAEELVQYDAFYAAAPDEKKIYLTFDCGYENGNTPAILDALKKHQVSAAFFVVGNFVKDNPELIR